MSNTPNPWQPVEPDPWATRPRSELPVGDPDVVDPTHVMPAVQSTPTPSPDAASESEQPAVPPPGLGTAPVVPPPAASPLVPPPSAAPAVPPAQPPQQGYARPTPTSGVSAPAGPAFGGPAFGGTASAYPGSAPGNPYAAAYPDGSAPGAAGYPSYGAAAPEVYPTAQSGYPAGGFAGSYPPAPTAAPVPGYPPAGAYVPQSPPQPAKPNFLKSLFDFSFSSYATPKLIKIIYVLAVVGAAGSWLLAIVYAVSLDALVRTGFLVGFTFLFGWIPALLGLALTRAVLEGVLAIIRTSEHTAEIAESLKARASADDVEDEAGSTD